MYKKGRQKTGIQRSRPQGNNVGAEDRGECLRQRMTIRRFEEKPFEVLSDLPDLCFSAGSRAIIQFRREANIRDRGRIYVSFTGKYLGRQPDGFGKITGDLRHSRKKEIAEIVPAEIADPAEPVPKEPRK